MTFDRGMPFFYFWLKTFVDSETFYQAKNESMTKYACFPANSNEKKFRDDGLYSGPAILFG